MKRFLFVFFIAFVAAVSVAGHQAVAADADWKNIQAASTGKELVAISCPSPRICYMVSGMYLSGGSGAIVKTTDGGETYTTLKLPTNNPFHAIACPTDLVCYAAGDFGTLLRTTDGGENWADLSLGSKSDPPQFTALFAFDEQKILVAGRGGLLYRTEDGGSSFSRPPMRTVSDFYSFYFLDTSTGYIAGNDGTLWKTMDAGATWTFQTGLRSVGLISRITGADKITLYAVGDKVNKSTDGGATWTELSLGMPKAYQAIAAPNAQTAYLISSTNSILKTSDGGATWQPELTLGNTFLHDLTCPSVSYCLAVGSSGKVFRLGTPPAVPLPPPPPVPAASTVSTTPAPITPLPTPAAPVAPAPVAAAPPPSASPVATVLTRTLKKGSRGADVKVLQGLLAAAGLFSKADISDTFGPLTVKAVGAFQEKYNLAKSGESGYGEAGPKTRAKLIDAAEGKAEPAPEKTSKAISVSIKRTLKKGFHGADVKKLQEILSADKEVYPEGDVSGYFGPATKKAVGKFQEKHNIAVPGDDGYGEVGPKTRAKFKELAN